MGLGVLASVWPARKIDSVASQRRNNFLSDCRGKELEKAKRLRYLVDGQKVLREALPDEYFQMK